MKDHAPAAVPTAAGNELSVEERARREQDGRCGQRHVDRAKAVLKETREQKQDRDDQCVELHRNDYVKAK
jgi:hypothetical protein